MDLPGRGHEIGACTPRMLSHHIALLKNGMMALLDLELFNLAWELHFRNRWEQSWAYALDIFSGQGHRSLEGHLKMPVSMHGHSP